MVVDYFLFTIAIIWIIAACITDIKKREVANWLSFSLLAIALAVRAITTIVTKETSYLVYALIGLAVFFVLANLFYYTRIFGGGDAKLLIALGPVFGVYPSFASVQHSVPQLPFFLVFFLNLLIVGAIYGLAYSMVLTLKNRKKVFKEVKKIYKNFKPKLLFLLALIALFVLCVLTLAPTMPFLLVLAIIPLILFPLFIYAKAVEDTCMIKIIKTQELVEGDWLAQQIKIGKKILNPTKKGLDIKEIRLIRKHYKKIKIKEGLPFVPTFFIATLISLFWGNVFIILFGII